MYDGHVYLKISYKKPALTNWYYFNSMMYWVRDTIKSRAGPTLVGWVGGRSRLSKCTTPTLADVIDGCIHFENFQGTSNILKIRCS